LLQELGGASILRKPILALVTRRPVLNVLPVAIPDSQVVEISDLDSLEEKARLVRTFDQTLNATTPSR
jgi:hypothetical protein